MKILNKDNTELQLTAVGTQSIRKMGSLITNIMVNLFMIKVTPIKIKQSVPSPISRFNQEFFRQLTSCASLSLL